jgi:D-alanyl-D-alanine-carboxypeptidase/D-alanyl-D-alanine-endopeptidase
MLNRRMLLCSALSGAAATVTSIAKAASPLSGKPLSALIAQEVDASRISAGLVAVMVNEKGRHYLSHGRSDTVRALDENTVFDIGSLTKLFTALALADMVAKGAMSMDDPVAKYLPPAVRIPDYAGRQITLLDLVTYAPGLPGWPQNLPPLNPEKPIPDYSEADLYAALSGNPLTAAPGTQYVYSNFGYGLLGLALSRRADMPFEDVIVSRICTPLGMNSTRIVIDSSMQARLTPGHNQKLEMVTSWNLPPALAGAGAFRSTAHDLAQFLEGAMGLRTGKSASPFTDLLQTRRPADKPGVEAAAGWFVSNGHGDELVWKDGSIVGYTSFMGYSAKSRSGIILLANGECGNIMPSLGQHLLNPDFPLQKA